jgi:hypothetical protein
MKAYPYSPIKALKCHIFGHDWMAYDFGTDKCLTCNKERRDGASALGMIRCNICGSVVCSCPERITK